jgi:hypothetical protein
MNGARQERVQWARLLRQFDELDNPQTRVDHIAQDLNDLLKPDSLR